MAKYFLWILANPDVSKAKLIAPEKDIPLEIGNGLTQIKKLLDCSLYEKWCTVISLYCGYAD